MPVEAENQGVAKKIWLSRLGSGQPVNTSKEGFGTMLTCAKVFEIARYKKIMEMMKYLFGIFKIKKPATPRSARYGGSK